MKGAVEQVLARFQARLVYFDRFPAEAGLTPAWLHPYRSARVAVDGITVGWFGQLHPREAAARKLKDTRPGRRTLSRSPLQAAAAQTRRARNLPLPAGAPRFFAHPRQSIPWENIDQAIAALQIPELVDWRAREVFRDAKLGAREYSLLARRNLPGADRTLREEELQAFKPASSKPLARQVPGSG